MKCFCASIVSAILVCAPLVYAKLNNSDGKKVLKYRPDWNDLDTRHSPEWYDNAKIGIFLHWGVYSVPSFGSEWFWMYWHKNITKYVDFMNSNYPPGFTYQDFAAQFTLELFDPHKWASVFADSGAKYIILTTKHHEGYTLFPSKRSFSWNSLDVGPKRDIVEDLSTAVRKMDLKFGIYHSLLEWFNPIYLDDKARNYVTRDYAVNKLLPDLYQLVNDYEPSVVWADGHGDAADTYWNATGFLAWLYNESPVKDEVVVNDRWGTGIPCKHGDFFTCTDRYNPGTLQAHKWENAFTIDRRSWGYRRNIDPATDILSIEEILTEVVSTVSCGGNALINVGPTKEGTIAPIFQERLLTLGKWLSINGEGIYGTSPWTHQNDSLAGSVWYTSIKQNTWATAKDNSTTIYAIVLKWPKHNVLMLRDIAPYLNGQEIEMLGNEGNFLKWSVKKGVAKIHLPDKAIVASEFAWTLKFIL